MKFFMRYLFLALMIALLSLPVVAQEESYHVLYSLHADVDGDGADERILMLSRDDADPTSRSFKEFWVMKLKGEKFHRVFTSGPMEAEFTNQMALWQLEGPDNMTPGISLLNRGERFPLIRVVFAPGSDYLADFQFDGKTYRDVTPEGP